MIEAYQAWSQYLTEIGKIPLLTKKEEYALSKNIIEKIDVQESIDKLVSANLRFVVTVAKRYTNYNCPIEDLVGYGTEGLITAAEKFDYHRGFRFISYAVWWIRQSISKQYVNNENTIRVPVNKVRIFNQIHKKTKNIPLGTETLTEVLDKMVEKKEVSEKHLEEYFSRPMFVSLDHKIGEGNKAWSISEIIGTDDSNTAILVDETFLETLFEQAKITSREANIVRLNFGLGDAEKHSLEELGKMYGVTRERIRQLRNKTLKELTRTAEEI